MHQTPMTVITEIKPESLDTLKKYLEPIGKDIKRNSVIQFSNYQQLHYCSFFIIPGKHPSGTDTDLALLVFEANIDGDVRQFIRDLITHNLGFLDEVYKGCVGYPGTSYTDKLVEYLLMRNYGANAFYIAHPGQTRATIFEQRQIRDNIEDHIDQKRSVLVSQQPSQIHRAIATQFSTVRRPAPQPFLNSKGEMLFKGLLAILTLTLLGGLFGVFGEFVQMLVILILIAVVGIAARLRWHEKRDKQDEKRWEAPNISEIQDVEDRQLQNHLTSVTEIKPGWLRLTTLRVVLASINLVAKLVATKGDLSGIVTIHFARWVILPGNKRLLFMSNYDGSWENYLGEFIDHASVGLTAVWSNTRLGKERGFPDTQWLALRGGSRDEQRFKAFARNSQLAELIWYSAYPDLSVKNIGNNRTIHEGLFSTTNPAEWLKCL